MDTEEHGLNADFFEKHKDNMKFFALLNEQQQGPFDEEAVQKMISGGEIKRDTLVCSEDGDVAWTPAKELFFQDSLPESFIPPQSIDEMLAEQSDDGSRLEIRLNSGADLKIKAVQLYDEIELVKVNSKKAEAMKMLKGVSTGIGPWGSIEWVLAASAVIGAVESVLSAGATSAGSSLLEEAIQAERKLRKEGVFFPVSKIQYIENPAPGFWRALAIKQKTGTRIKTAASAFVHNGDEFISLMTDDNLTCSIRWSAVESHFYSKSMP
jgi:GYF domain 2